MNTLKFGTVHKAQSWDEQAAKSLRDKRQGQGYKAIFAVENDPKTKRVRIPMPYVLVGKDADAYKDIAKQREQNRHNINGLLETAETYGEKMIDELRQTSLYQALIETRDNITEQMNNLLKTAKPIPPSDPNHKTDEQIEATVKRMLELKSKRDNDAN